jgi:gamma-glutamylcyclotransferase (GGCT)/AIG2-like uncharacterized protein YtfP
MNAPQAPDSRRLLFTYGTLMLTTGIAEVDEAMRKAGKSLGRAYIHGRVYDLGDYPGAVPIEPDGSEDAPKVWGHLLLLDDPAALFAVIDPYEGFEEGNPSGSEFVRALASVTLADKNKEGKGFLSQVYYYNFPLGGREPIASGDYLAHWKAKGKPAQGRTGG